ncbi:MAG: hypothetical protein HYZ28_20075 [Myxococcales bacterium]|nr:hypothetical protein [Myxococcales bacterium]
MRLGCLQLFLLLALGGCGPRPPSNLPPLELLPGCQPLLAGHDCHLPFPSDFFRTEDALLPSGFRIAARGAAKPRTSTGLNADVTDWRPADGFSSLPTLVAVLPSAVSPAGLVGVLDAPEASLGPDSPVLLLEAETNSPLPHFTDLDPRATEPTRQAIVIHPIVRLEARTRYVVGIHGLRQPDGELAPAPEGFRRLRDRQSAGDPALKSLQARFDEQVFPVLEAAGLQRSQLQLAWDFTTGSEEHVLGDMLRVRELALAALASSPPKVKVESVEEAPEPGVWRLVRGTVEAPLFLDDPGSGGRLIRGGDGRVEQSGTAAVPFLALVPVAVRDQFGPGRPLAYGHGFFGGRDEIEGNDSVTAIANRLGAVVFSIDWWGMSRVDLLALADAALARPFEVAAFTDRVHQAMANWLAMTSAIRGPLREEPAFRRPASPGAPGVSTDASGQSNAGHTLLEPGAPYFLGISQGHILGGTLAALNPDFRRICLNVGGAGLTHMMFRARPFVDLVSILEKGNKDPLEQQKFAATLQVHLDRIDPGFWASRVLAEPLPGSPSDRRLLLQVGLGDTEVPNLGSFLHARLLGVPVLTPSPSQVYGLYEVPSPHQGSAMELFDFGIDLDAAYRSAWPPESENPVHEGVRRLDAAIEQMDLFFRPEGRIVRTCAGVCDPG